MPPHMRTHTRGEAPSTTTHHQQTHTYTEHHIYTFLCHECTFRNRAVGLLRGAHHCIYIADDKNLCHGKVCRQGGEARSPQPQIIYKRTRRPNITYHIYHVSYTSTITTTSTSPTGCFPTQHHAHIAAARCPNAATLTTKLPSRRRTCSAPP